MMRAAAVTEKASRVAPLAHWPKWPLLGQLLYRFIRKFCGCVWAWVECGLRGEKHLANAG